MKELNRKLIEIKEFLTRGIHSHNVFFGVWKVKTTMPMEEERKGPAEEILQKYASYMKQLLDCAGYTK